MGRLSIESSLREKLPSFNFFWAEFRGIEIVPFSSEFLQAFEKEKASILKNYSLETLKNQENISLTRQAFKALGLDPARYRPSSEALLRRLLLNKEITFINNAVDLINLLSLKYKLAMGIYDSDKIKGDLVIREGRESEEYLGINARLINCKSKIVLVDSQGVVGSPYVDSQRTKVDWQSKNLIHVIYLVPSKFKEDFSEARKLASHFLGGDISSYWKVETLRERGYNLGG
ncbi:MAG TPA: hypothetical protein ENI31_06075 [Candidatus Omnitrophica bacterium]|nr:MAG: hypothetical protein DRP61_04745 [Candidatus Omnitrophota bacterium]RKY34649.1 MAG: hypothetical protein DRP69_04100 [Candidatus Omnitrophota bacterium]RKY42485.1 MAG: hypothetical protein DRP80_06745 [Candidatus Omnitrophota bacterium]HEC69830.1 hypothetical protein [Candidatus Omnitrophota bacterium]